VGKTKSCVNRVRLPWNRLRAHGSFVGGKLEWLKAVFAGLVWFCAFAPLQCELAAWLTPAMLLWATCAEPKRAFCLGWVAGAAHFFSSLSWVLYIPVAGSNIVGWVMLSGYCAIYPAIWVAFCWLIFPGDRTDVGKAVSQMPFKVRLLWGGACAVGWVAQECLRGWVITGFPWNYLGGSQINYTQLAMLAQFTGVLGVSLVVAWGSVGALLVFWCWRQKDRFTPCLLLEVAVPLLLLMVALGLGRSVLSQPLAQKRGSLKIALVQPAIPQTVLWNAGDQKSQEKRFEDMMDLSEAGVDGDVDLLVWPEASLPPLGILNPSNVVERFTNLEESIREKKIWRVWGADTATNGVPYNSAVLIPPEDGFLRGLGEIEWSSYAKRHLVMFGEYVPFSGQLPFLRKLAPVGNFGRGVGPVVFDMGNAKTSVIICFEDVVPKLARRAATEEVDFLLNLTNDGWFGNSHQQWQHARTAAWRAIENRRPLVRCCNNGITGWADEFGQFHGVTEDVYSKGTRVVEIPLRRGPRSPTFYQRYGDWLPWGAVFVCILIGVMQVKGRWFEVKKDSESDANRAK